MKKSKKVAVKILKVTKYRDFDVLVQRIGFTFQAVICAHGKFYQNHMVITPPNSKCKRCGQVIAPLSDSEELEAAKVAMDMACTTIDAILVGGDGKKLEEQNKQGAEVLNILESMPTNKN